MLAFPAAIRIYVALEPVDMRKQYDGLWAAVQQQLGDGVVRTIAMGPSEGLKRNMVASNTGAPISVPVGKPTLGRIMNVLGVPIDHKGPVETDSYRAIHQAAPSYEDQSGATELLETGIKVNPLACRQRNIICALLALSLSGFKVWRLSMALSPKGVAALSRPRRLALKFSIICPNDG